MSNSNFSNELARMLLQEQLRRRRTTTTRPENSESGSDDEEQQSLLITRLFANRLGSNIMIGREREPSARSRPNATNEYNEEQLLNRLVAMIPHRSIEDFRVLIHRMNSLSSNFQVNLIDHYEELAQAVTHDEQMSRRYFREDDIAESFDELYFEELNEYTKNSLIKDAVRSGKINLIDNSYIDFKSYPLNIEWTLVNDQNSHAYDVLDKYGMIGCFIYCKLNEAKMKIKYYRIDSELINTFISTQNEVKFKSNSLDVAYSKAAQLIACLPSISKLNLILSNYQISLKEIVLLKVIIDIYECYLRIGVDYNKHKYESVYCEDYTELCQNYINYLDASQLSDSGKDMCTYQSIIKKIESKSVLKESYKHLIKMFGVDFLASSKYHKNRLKALYKSNKVNSSGLSRDNFYC